MKISSESAEAENIGDILNPLILELSCATFIQEVRNVTK